MATRGSRYYSNSSDDSGLVAVSLLLLCLIWLVRRLHFLQAMRRYLMVVVAASVSLVSFGLVAAYYRKWQQRLRPRAWDKMSGLAFERQVVNWLKLIGYSDVKQTEYFDQGLDIIAFKDDQLIGFQVKRSHKPVGVAAVRAAVTALKAYNCDQVMVITNAKFTPAAVKLAHVNNCQLIDGERMRTASKT